MTSFRVLKADTLDILHIRDDLLFLNKPAHLAIYDVNTLEVYDFAISYAAVWDGLSTPKCLRWFLPSYDPKNDLFNWAGLIHDALYGSALLPKDVADDVFRSVLRDAGLSRFKASSAEFVMSKFSKSHYGRTQDRHGIRFHVKMNVTRR
nr:MAG TPA: Protein of unknown function (DUF1353) [Caudoviricetes sp.]